MAQYNNDTNRDTSRDNRDTNRDKDQKDPRTNSGNQNKKNTGTSNKIDR